MLFSFLNNKPKAIADPKPDKLAKTLTVKVPPKAIEYVLSLWNQHPFNFRMPKSRKSCLGNYRQQGNSHTVTVNADLNQYSFLITLIHEIAHQHVAVYTKMFRRKPEPHGIEWKNTFANLMLPILTEEVFPDEILIVLKNHMRNPAASSMRDHELVQVLRKYDPVPAVSGFKLETLSANQKFVFNHKPYKKIENRRTRTLVECIKTKRKYTIPSFVEVGLID